MKKKEILRIAAAAVAALALTACGETGKTAGSETTGDGKQTTVRLGVVGENNEQWTPVINRLAEEGITLELVKFADYTLPNQALADGEIDLNSFQHYAYLNNEIKDKGLDLTVIGETVIAPLGVYSERIDSLDQLKEGDQIAIPNDATNEGAGSEASGNSGAYKDGSAGGIYAGAFRYYGQSAEAEVYGGRGGPDSSASSRCGSGGH